MIDRDELVPRLREGTFGSDITKTDVYLNAICSAAADQIERDGREIEELRRLLGGGCDASAGGYHTVITQGRYRFCGKCGESLTGVRYCHAPRAALNGEGPAMTERMARVICAACGWRGRRKTGQIVTCPCCGMIATYEVEGYP